MKNETLIYPSAVRAHPPPSPHPSSPRGNTEAFTEDKRRSWIFTAPTPPETQQNLLRSAPRNPPIARYNAGSTEKEEVLVLLLSSSLSPTLTYHLPTHIQMLKHLHTHMHTLSSTYMLLCLRGLAAEHRDLHRASLLCFCFFFRSSFFLVRKVIWLASWRNRPASARRRMSQMRRGIIWE